MREMSLKELRNTYRRIKPVERVERKDTTMSVEENPSKTMQINRAFDAIFSGAKRIELESAEWEVTAYKMGLPGQIRIDINKKKKKELFPQSEQASSEV